MPSPFLSTVSFLIAFASAKTILADSGTALADEKTRKAAAETILADDSSVSADENLILAREKAALAEDEMAAAHAAAIFANYEVRTPDERMGCTIALLRTPIGASRGDGGQSPINRGPPRLAPPPTP